MLDKAHQNDPIDAELDQISGLIPGRIKLDESIAVSAWADMALLKSKESGVITGSSGIPIQLIEQSTAADAVVNKVLPKNEKLLVVAPF